MTFDTRNGTRGARQPSGAAARWGNKLMAGRVRKGRAKFLGFNTLVLTTVGAKSGAERATPVGWFPGPGGSWLVVASAAGATMIFTISASASPARVTPLGSAETSPSPAALVAVKAGPATGAVKASPAVVRPTSKAGSP